MAAPELFDTIVTVLPVLAAVMMRSADPLVGFAVGTARVSNVRVAVEHRRTVGSFWIHRGIIAIRQAECVTAHFGGAQGSSGAPNRAHSRVSAVTASGGAGSRSKLRRPRPFSTCSDRLGR